MRNQVVVIGCPRSGTKFIAQLFQEHGFDVGHECWGKDGISWFYSVADNTLKDMNSRLTIVHQVRHPLLVIPSITTALPKTWKFMFEQVARPMPENKMHRAMILWLEWNRLAERKTSYRYQVEKIHQHFDNICHMAWGANIKLKPQFKTAVNTNTRPHPVLTLETCMAIDADLTRDIVAMAHRYGYPI